MLDKFWCALLGLSLLAALALGETEAAATAGLTAAADAVQTVLGMAGVVCLWMGLLEIAAASGLSEKLGRLLRPLVARLFPSVPHRHPALDSITMNISANLLGLGNAATPCGLQAMAQLQQLNPQPEQASPAMVTLLVLNTAGITVLPTMIISLRAQAGSAQPAAIVGAAFLSSLLGMVGALLLDAWQRRRS